MKILVIDGHPYSKSLCSALAESYIKGAKEANYEIEVIKLRDIKFNPILQSGYIEPMKLEPDLVRAQELLNWCEHLVIVTPYWWAGLPALLKGFIDRTLLPGFAFKFKKNGIGWDKLLQGRSARVIYTQGSPFIYSKFILLDAFWRSLKTGTLSFCGFSPVKRTYLDNISKSTTERNKKFIKKVYELGKRGK